LTAFSSTKRGFDKVSLSPIIKTVENPVFQEPIKANCLQGWDAKPWVVRKGNCHLKAASTDVVEVRVNVRKDTTGATFYRTE